MKIPTITGSPEQIDTEVARQMQVVGHDAWSVAFKNTRGPDEIAGMYNPGDPDYVEAKRQRYHSVVKNGGVICLPIL